MEMNENTIVISRTRHQWENHLSFETRAKFITLYEEGYAVYKIASSYEVTAGTVEYHLRTAGVYVAGKKPTKRGLEIPGCEKVLHESHTLSILIEQPKLSKLGQLLYEEDRKTERMQRKFPKTYAEYLAIAKKRHPMLYNGLYASTTNTYNAS